MPDANLAPYHADWNHSINRPGGKTRAANRDRDTDFARVMMYVRGFRLGSRATSTPRPCTIVPAPANRKGDERMSGRH
jgi:hypothetical protein